MILFNNWDIEKLIIKLQSKLRRNKYTSHEFPKFVFICGKDITDTKDNLRCEIIRILESHKVSSDYLHKKTANKSVISEYLYNNNGVDVLTFEKILAEISDVIIIIIESAGTLCELGAFALDDNFVKKMIVINDGNYQSADSFVNNGPIKKLQDIDDKKVLWRWENKRLLKSLEFKTLVQNISSNNVEFFPNICSNNNGDYVLDLKNLIYELINILELFQPLERYELEEIYKKIRNINTYSINNFKMHKISSLSSVIDLMLKMKIISAIQGLYRVNNDITCFNSMFKISREEFNEFRSIYLCKMFKYAPFRLEEIVS